jgi:LemA protein
MMRRSLWIASGVTVVVVMVGLLVYGSYISAQYQMEALKTSTREQWTQLDGAIRRMAELTPQVEAAVAPAAKENQTALEALTTAQRTVLQAHDPKAVAGASRALDEALDSVLALGLSDPQVKGDARFEALRERLRGMRVRIVEDRDRYNESLRNYNLFLGEFPNELWARIAGYVPDREFFPAPQGQS